MPRQNRTPKYGLHNATGQARVKIDGQPHYLGAHGSSESKRRYKELVDRWRLEQDARIQPAISLGQLALLYMQHVVGYYQKDGEPTSEVASISCALKPLLRQFRAIEVADFGPMALRAYQKALVNDGVSRLSCNKYVARVVRMVRWAVSQEYCSQSVLTALETVDGLKKGRTMAKESKGVQPVDPADVEAIKDHIGHRLWGTIQFQLHTVCRPGEALIVRACDIDMSGDVWTYTPASHKTEHHGKKRRILIGPKGQAVVRAHLTTNTQAYLFGVEGTERPYKRHSYTVAVRRACRRATEAHRRAAEKAGQQEYRVVPAWKPKQLRHTAATRIRRAANVETAKTALGHSDIRVTEIYAERDMEAAKAVIAKIG